MTYQVVFRIRGAYFQDVVSGKRTVEVRRTSPYWSPRAYAAMDSIRHNRQVIGVFISGHRVHRREVSAVAWWNSARAVLGREPTTQGERDLGDGPVWAFSLSEEVDL